MFVDIPTNLHALNLVTKDVNWYEMCKDPYLLHMKWCLHEPVMFWLSTNINLHTNYNDAIVPCSLLQCDGQPLICSFSALPQ